MTTLVCYKGKFYSDSRTSNYLGVASDETIKIKKPMPSQNPMWDKDLVLCVMGAGISSAIDKVVNILFRKGKEGIDALYETMRLIDVELGTVYLFIATTNSIISLRLEKGKLKYTKHPKHRFLVLGSGSPSAILGVKLFRTDGVGAICIAQLLDEKSGGYINSLDPWAKDDKVKSKYYGYLRTRIVLGVLFKAIDKLKTKYYI